MGVPVGGCYYHEGRLAVSVCAKCGVGICKECAVRDDSGRILCIDCANEESWQEHQRQREILKKEGGRFRHGTEFVAPTIKGILIAAVVGLILYISDSYSVCGIAEIIGTSYILFSIPFGIIMINDRFAVQYGSSDRRLKRFFISVTIGWAAFAFYLIRFICRKIKSK